MHAQMKRRGAALASLAVVTVALAGCSLLGSPEPENTAAANDALAAKFVACLIDQGQEAKILDGGMVGMGLPDDAEPEDFMGGGDGSAGELSTGGGDGESDAPTMVAIMKDEEGEWMAATSAEGYPDDYGMRDAWTACEAEVPDFEQPEPDMDGGNTVTAEEQMQAALDFSQCARDNGYPEFPDPGERGEMNLPADITEDGFRTLLEDCFDPEHPMGLMMTPELSESLDFDLMAVMEDFFEEHPELQPENGGGAGPATTSPDGSE
ncbi:MAG: hypothetical protein ABIR65_01600 [Pseudolysinimonas sp.]